MHYGIYFPIIKDFVKNSYGRTPYGSTITTFPWSDFPFLGSAIFISVIVCVYLVIVLKLGPTIMKNQIDINLKAFALCYYVCQAIFSGLFFYSSFTEILFQNNDLTCLISTNRSGMIVYLFLLNKLFDLFEDGIHMGRHDWHMLSSIHIYRNVMVPVIIFLDLYMQPGGQTMYFILISSLVNTIASVQKSLSNWQEFEHIFQKWKAIEHSMIMICHLTCAIACGLILLFSNCDDKKHPAILIAAISQFSLMAYVAYENQQNLAKYYRKRFL